MNIIDELAQAFQETFDDKHLSKSERKALLGRIQEANLDQRKQDILRSKVFDIARAGMLGGEAVFALEWVEDASRLLNRGQTKAARGSSVYFSPGDACLDAILTQIRNARQQLNICVFTISDDRITNAILERHSRGVQVRVITDNDKLHDAGSDIAAIAASGVEVRVDRTPYHMHHKFCVVDGNSVITGSYNWTRSAATRNEENVLVTEEDVVVDRYQDEFKALWKKTVPF